MRPVHRIRRAVLASLPLVILAARPALAVGTHSGRVPAIVSVRPAVAHESTCRSYPGPPPTTQRPGAPLHCAFQIPREEGRRPSQLRATLAVSNVDRWRRDGLPARLRDGHVAAPAAIFHDANAPPVLLSAIAGVHS
jgi:hypothetical protein